MLAINIFLMVWLQIVLVNTLQFKKPVAEIKWRGKCQKKQMAVNDCNWCRCNQRSYFSCNARVCSEVDVFGHFNDAITEVDPGMEGHGSWRSKNTACEPNVQYRRADLLCVCTEEGSWPSPVCRDVFRVLHSVEVSGVTVAKGQVCQPNTLYLVGCNVCLCNSRSRLDPELCTKRECTEDDPAIQAQGISEEENVPDTEINNNNYNNNDEVYAECRPDFYYQIGCNNCKCLRNNRLLCDDCTPSAKALASSTRSFCEYKKEGHVFSRDCNLCHCKEGYAYCTAKKCLPPTHAFNIPKLLRAESAVNKNNDTENCVPGVTFRDGCNQCFCHEDHPRNTIVCTLKSCVKPQDVYKRLHQDCVVGTTYEVNCLICHCKEVDGIKKELCQENPKCRGNKVINAVRTNNLDSLHGYCEPLHEYKVNCNKCTCMSDGKTLKCTPHYCDSEASNPITVDIVPVHQDGRTCPKGLSYKIDCNYCFCLSNGNALCTTAKCDKDVPTKNLN